MKIIKKIVSIAFISVLLLQIVKSTTYASPSITSRNLVKVAVFLNDFNDQFISNVRNNLEDIQKENENKVQFTFFDAKGNQVYQNESIEQVLYKDFNLFVINPVSTDINKFENTLNKLLQKNIPLILYYAKTPSIVNYIKGSW